MIDPDKVSGEMIIEMHQIDDDVFMVKTIGTAMKRGKTIGVAVSRFEDADGIPYIERPAFVEEAPV